MAFYVLDVLFAMLGHSVILAPGGTHLMFESLSAAFRQGGQVPVTLDFEHVGAAGRPLLARTRNQALRLRHG
ncbi:copper chaperone PCu(A)C [Bradyrhizobium sp. ARR65]|uniref:copper chaperone PCu(A)C n=1 Tax=Bradyrhizobium sp. ARR65 TaxID=1040989 RepID=UPI000555C296|nr:copper chaperone PCu(A)C [Bradyrhizobium sp. ARR65]